MEHSNYRPEGSLWESRTDIPPGPGVVLGWHVLSSVTGQLAHIPPGVRPLVGATYYWDGRVIPCVSGLHASKRLYHALCYKDSPLICRVASWGDLRTQGNDKHTAQYRKVLWRINAGNALMEEVFAFISYLLACLEPGTLSDLECAAWEQGQAAFFACDRYGLSKALHTLQQGATNESRARYTFDNYYTTHLPLIKAMLGALQSGGKHAVLDYIVCGYSIVDIMEFACAVQVEKEPTSLQYFMDRLEERVFSMHAQEQV